MTGRVERYEQEQRECGLRELQERLHWEWRQRSRDDAADLPVNGPEIDRAA